MNVSTSSQRIDDSHALVHRMGTIWAARQPHQIPEHGTPTQQLRGLDPFDPEDHVLKQCYAHLAHAVAVVTVDHREKPLCLADDPTDVRPFHRTALSVAYAGVLGAVPIEQPASTDVRTGFHPVLTGHGVVS